MFDALFKVVSTLFGPLTIEKYIEHPHFISCSSFKNLRLGCMTYVRLGPIKINP